MVSTLFFCAGIGSVVTALLFANLLGTEGPELIIESTAGAIGGIFLLLGVAARQRETRAEAAAFEFINSQATVFGRRRGHLVFKDDYGQRVSVPLALITRMHVPSLKTLKRTKASEHLISPMYLI